MKHSQADTPLHAVEGIDRPQDVAATLDYAAPVEPSLTARTARGFSWLFGETIVFKIFSLAGQILLAWLLVPQDFGIFAVALTVTSFIGLLRSIGLREVLVQRQREFRRWANAATWMAGATGIANTLLTVLVAWAFFRGSPLAGLLIILGASAPFTALQTVPVARLQNEFRFATLAMIRLVIGIASTVLCVLLAYKGLGAYSLAWPRLFGAVAQMIALFAVANPGVRPYPQIRRWGFLLRDAAYMFGTTLCSTVIMYADYAILALWYDGYVVGIYFFAFGLATQTVQMLGQNLAAAFLPALSALQDEPQRQTNAFFRGCRVIAFVAVPACFLQAALAGPIIRLLFDERWIPSIPVFTVLSMGMAFVLLGGPAATMFQAQGRFGPFLRWSIASAVGFTAFVGMGVLLGDGALGVAVAVTLFFVIFGPLGIYAATRSSGGGFRDILRIYVPATCASVVAIGIPRALTFTMAPTLADWATILIVTGAALPLYLLLGWMAMPAETAELQARLGLSRPHPAS